MDKYKNSILTGKKASTEENAYPPRSREAVPRAKPTPTRTLKPPANQTSLSYPQQSP